MVTNYYRMSLNPDQIQESFSILEFFNNIDKNRILRRRGSYGLISSSPGLLRV